MYTVMYNGLTCSPSEARPYCSEPLENNLDRVETVPFLGNRQVTKALLLAQ